MSELGSGRLGNQFRFKTEEPLEPTTQAAFRLFRDVNQVDFLVDVGSFFVVDGVWPKVQPSFHALAITVFDRVPGCEL